MTDVIRYSYFTENNIRELFDTLIEGIVSFLDEDKINKIWELYLGDNIDKNKHIEFINNMREFKIVSIVKYDALINDLYDRYKSYEDIPNEFIDPMICELIEDPIEIPITKLIMDAKIIYKHIVLKNDNPFNRQPLTIEELEKYQTLEEVKFRIDEWKKREKEWLNSF
jgi:hypothetical protein